jgi:hypothetical protein
MAALFGYMQSTQRLLRDTKAELLNPDDLRIYVNQARREVALRAQCVRLLTPVSGAVITASVIAGGTGYTAPTVSITPPDFPSGSLPYPNGRQATANATLGLGRAISGVNITLGGAGYFQPIATITDPTGTGASVALTVQGVNTLNLGQEVYPFSSVSLTPFPGYGSIYMVKSASIIYADYRYSLPMYSFSAYQAYVRKYPFQYQFVPTVASQYGQGANGSFYMYPLPSQQYQVELDCFCLPSDLSFDTDADVVPAPWRDACKFYAAYLCYLELQNMNSARAMLDAFERQVSVYSQAARPGRMTNPYGRW